MVRPVGHELHLRHLSVLTSFAQAGIGPEDESVKRAASWLAGQQHADGGWGESNDSYGWQSRPAETGTHSNPYQTAWALLGLLAAGQVDSNTVRNGIEYLVSTQEQGGLWSDPTFTAPGFPRVFYLKYHGYCAYFPLWALAAYRNLSRAGAAH